MAALPCVRGVLAYTRPDPPAPEAELAVAVCYEAAATGAGTMNRRSGKHAKQQSRTA